jgi:DNA gyrase subunit A
MGRATSGVTGMKFRDGDELLSMSVIRAEQIAAEEAADHEEGGAEASPEVREQYVFTMTDGGYAKRTRISEYRLQSRGGIGIKAMQQNDDRGSLVGAFIVEEGDEVMSVTSSGQVVRSPINEEFRPKGRATMGVTFVKLRGGDSVSVVARSVERAAEIEEASAEAEAEALEADEASVSAVEGDHLGNATIDGDGAAVPSKDETEADSSGDQPTEES